MCSVVQFAFLCNLSRKNNKIESESQLSHIFLLTLPVVTYPVKIIKLKANHNPVFLYAITILCCNLSRKNNKIESESQLRVRDAGLNCVVTYPVKIIKLKANHNGSLPLYCF